MSPRRSTRRLPWRGALGRRPCAAVPPPSGAGARSNPSPRRPPPSPPPSTAQSAPAAAASSSSSPASPSSAPRANAAPSPPGSTASAPPPPPPPPPSMKAPVRAQSAALPPAPSPATRTLFLDLDETLIHAQTDPPTRFDFAVRPIIGGQAVTFYVAKRPGVEAFLRAAAERFEVVVFTAGLQEYASLVLDRLDPDGELFAHRLYRGACRDAGDGRLVKDLAATGRALDRVVIVDDNPNAYALQPENAVPVAPFVDDDNDQELHRVMAFLNVTAGFGDTREAIEYYKELITAS
ncbi:hypothetical protein PR202_gb24606 [Eleusine coracana subsp. coracana]|uniref:FCP1 homology domain-containing protein n=1 Tax=Eleusine coracana subsp. coracana TaxID=191504 RepID=A0AAV5FJ33_ELECO|nr:hypothetical protein PR202_gb24606 [Eleusine coracana subsp. coracana]